MVGWWWGAMVGGSESWSEKAERKASVGEHW